MRTAPHIRPTGNHMVAISWLVGASLFLYGWWNPAYLGLILASILFKYANFFVEKLNTLSGFSHHLETIILPLAISFFTFQQITFLVDASRGETREYISCITPCSLPSFHS